MVPAFAEKEAKLMPTQTTVQFFYSLTSKRVFFYLFRASDTLISQNLTLLETVFFLAFEAGSKWNPLCFILLLLMPQQLLTRDLCISP